MSPEEVLNALDVLDLTYYWFGRTVVQSFCVYEVATFYSKGRLPALTALCRRYKIGAWGLAGWVAFHLLMEARVHQRILNYRASVEHRAALTWPSSCARPLASRPLR